ncbi:lipocalin family protein [uncultured Coprobacter sp.]|uniref:lipocalin family protein n=1 Tax=uncultured Coprobacter sp. TaxID=1720550 RepID=UPI0026049897|nr:lipocalin family protein [uncultured Coprobacter sp.]
MKYLINFTVILSITILTACNSVNIEGSWVEPIPGIPDMKQGFTLKTKGDASSINMESLLYEKWEHKNNLLILSGTSIGNHQTLSFTDTLIIEKLTQDSLILKKGKLILRYAKADETEIIKNTPMSKILAARQPFPVKGQLIIGHEVRSFTAENDSCSYWIIDPTEELTQKYDEITKGIKSGIPVYVELEVVDMGKADDGFAADYDGVYSVTKINKIANY